MAAHTPDRERLSQLEQLIAPFAAHRAPVVAQRLLARFGSLRLALSASPEALRSALEEDAAIADQLTAARLLHEAALREQLVGEPVQSTSEPFLRYLLARLGSRREECLLVVYLNQSGLFLTEEFSQGDASASCRIPLRRMVRRSLELDARRLILAHNHVSGNPAPSRRDIATTRQLAGVLQALGMTLEDHCIVTSGAITSMSKLALI